MTHRFSVRKALIAVSAVLVLAACGSGGSSSGGGGGGGTKSGPVHGGDLVFAAVQDAQSMNATTVFDNNSIWIFEQIYQTLYTVTNDGKSVRPQLATSYTVSTDKKTYTFKLRHGVKFSNGKPMTSADVKFSIDQNRKATKGWAYIDSAIKSVDAPAPDTVVIHLKFTWAPLLADLSFFANGVVPNNYGGETETQFYNHPIGTGPFKWDFWHKGAALKLVRNPQYWEKGKPYLNSVTWTDVANDNTRELQLKGGQAQVDQTPAWSTVSSLKTTSGVTMNLFNSTQTNYLAFNETRKPFQDVHVRRAISLAIDRNALVKAVLFGNGKPANSLFPPQVPFYDPNTPGLQFNLAQAKAEMAKSSVPHGFTTSITHLGREFGLQDHRHHPAVRAEAARHQAEDHPARPECCQQRRADTEVRHGADALDDGHPRPRRARDIRGRPQLGRQVLLHRLQQPNRRQGHSPGRDDDRHRQAAAVLQRDPGRRRQRRVHGLPVLLALSVRHHEQRARLLRDAARQHAHGRRLAEQVTISAQLTARGPAAGIPMPAAGRLPARG